MKRLVLELEEDLHQKIKIKALQERKNMRQVMTELLNKWLKNGIKQDGK